MVDTFFAKGILSINFTKWSHKCTEDSYVLVLYWPDHCLLWCQRLCVVLWLVAVGRIHLGLSAGQAENQYWFRPPKLVLEVWLPARISSNVCPSFSSTQWCLTYLPTCSRCTISGACVEHPAAELLPNKCKGQLVLLDGSEMQVAGVVPMYSVKLESKHQHYSQCSFCMVSPQQRNK